MTIGLPKLPYEKNALEPHISAETLGFHYEKHHNAYVVNLNKLIVDTPFSNESLEEIIVETHEDHENVGIFNNAAQVWNHTFYWQCMKPNGGGKPEGELFEAIEHTFGSFDEFKAEFKQAASTLFGSGWTWLVLDKGALKIVRTSNAEVPFTHGMVPLLTCDVWEHAYYIDYQNRRPDYVDTFMEHLVNWDFVQENFAKA